MYRTLFSTIFLISDFEVDIDYPDNNINDGCQVKTNTPNDCLHYCQMYPGCKGFSWVTPDFHNCPKGCWIKSKMEGRKYRENVISGFAGMYVCKMAYLPIPVILNLKCTKLLKRMTMTDLGYQVSIFISIF